ncbi:MAG: hypothetical protein ACC648_08640 [Thiohalobacterales bacterium]
MLTGHAIESTRIRLGEVSGAGWSIHGLQARFAWVAADRAALQLEAESITLPAAAVDITDVRLECPMAMVTAQQIVCAAGQLNFHSTALGPQQAAVSFSYQAGTRALVLSLDRLRVDAGRLSLRATMQAGSWDLSLQGSGVSPERFSARLAALNVLPAGVEGSGSIDVTASLQGDAAGVQACRLQVQLRTEEFSDASGNLAGDQVELELTVGLKRAAANWQLDATIDGRKGQLYIDPVFLDLDARPLTAAIGLDWQPGVPQLAVRSFELQQPGALKLQARGVINPERDGWVEQLAVELQRGELPALYETWLQPWLGDTLFADLQTAGGISGQLHWDAGKLSGVSLVPEDLALNDNEQRFGLNGINGQLNWTRTGAVRPSELRWDNGHLYKVPLGSARVAATADATALRLREPGYIEVLDGELQFNEFVLEYPEGVLSRWQVDGLLTPVSMRRLTRSLGWPEFAGKLSGTIPNVEYTDGMLAVGGELLVRVFDGEITLSKLKLERPFSVVPRLQVDARVKGLDLEILTRTFSFGRIEGRLDGRIDGLLMESWRPVAFDAGFATPLDDDSRHRISQQALDNITSIGGGVGGALSRTFLRFFEDFPYDRLGISCRLENGTCAMDGVAPAPNGYYIVKGRLLPPRIDVIGYADQVNWNTLMAQLVAVVERQGAVVE